MPTGTAPGLTLKDLYEALDWSAIEAAETTWLEGHEQAAAQLDGHTIEPDFRTKFRMAILEEAVQGTDEARQQDARKWLQRAGVWPSVLRFYREHRLLSDG